MKKNKIIILIELIIHFIKSILQSISLFFRHIFGNKKINPIQENRFLDAMNFILHIGPKNFWKKPTGIKIGRSPVTFLNYIFHKEENFREKK